MTRIIEEHLVYEFINFTIFTPKPLLQMLLNLYERLGTELVISIVTIVLSIRNQKDTNLPF